MAGNRWLFASAILLATVLLGSAWLLADPARSGQTLRLVQAATAVAAVLAFACLAVAWVDQHHSQQKAQRAEAALALQRELLDAMQSAVVLWDSDDRLVMANRDFLSVYPTLALHLKPGLRFEEALRASIAAGLVPEAQEDPEPWIARRLALRRQPAGPMLRELTDGRWRLITEQRLSDGSLMAHSVDVTELVRREQALATLNQQLDEANAELARLSDTDGLTGLGNRRLFDRRLAEECARAARHGTPLALLLVDVDHFKRYNDHHGHPAGDACLVQVARLLEQAARRPGDLVARVGGEEFALLLPHLDSEAALAQALRSQAALTEAALTHGDTPLGQHITISVGVAVWQAAPEATSDVLLPAQLMARADAALYQAKHEGRARSVLHTEAPGCSGLASA
jgi:diguanylate cyclase (GGDEF)-like protein